MQQDFFRFQGSEGKLCPREEDRYKKTSRSAVEPGKSNQWLGRILFSKGS
jgi:hypothetical protein